MKIRAFATLLGIAGIAGLAAPLAADKVGFRLDSISATVGANGRVTYQIAGEFTQEEEVFRWHTRVSGPGIYDPASRRASENLVTPAGATTRTSASCFPDPWLFAASCTDSRIESTVWTPVAAAVFGVPITAGMLSDWDRKRVKAAFDQALADKAAADRRAAADKWAADKAAAERKAAADKLAAERNAPTALARKHAAGLPPSTPKAPPPPPPPPAPKYGATYAPASFSNLRKGKTETVQVKVTNTGNFPWGANSAFRLSYHWYKGANALQIGGEQTALPQAVTPNQAVTVRARVKAPSNAGTYTLRWDMLQQGVTWFSQKGVATRDQTVVVK